MRVRGVTPLLPPPAVWRRLAVGPRTWRGLVGPREPLVSLILIFLASRAALFVVAAFTALAIGRDPLSVPTLVCHFDCSWYARIATSGYSLAAVAGAPGQSSFAFFPLYPMEIEALRLIVPVDAITAGTLLSNLFFFGALAYVYAYARLLGLTNAGALTAVALLSALPATFVFSSVYPDSLFLLLLAGAVYHLHRRELLIAAIYGGLLSAVRPNGLIFLAFAGLWAGRQFSGDWIRGFWREPRSLVPLVAAPAGLFAFAVFSFVRTRDVFAAASASGHGWGVRAVLPWDNALTMLGQGGVETVGLAVLMSASVGVLLLLRFRMYEEFALCVAGIGYALLGSFEDPPLRNLIVLFPLWVALARAVESDRAARFLVVLIAVPWGAVLTMAWVVGDRIAG